MDLNVHMHKDHIANSHLHKKHKIVQLFISGKQKLPQILQGREVKVIL